MNWIKRAWRGEEKLWKVIWVYGILISICIGIFAGALVRTGIDGMAVGLPLILFNLIYFIWCMVSQWRCAFNTDWKVWGYIVRVLVVLSILAILFEVVRL